MVNVNKLKGKMAENQINVAELAAKIGIDKATLYRKINSNCRTLTIEEADLIAKELSLTFEEVNTIFFAQYVA